ncbi:MAG: VanW family protein [Candidatus Limnocylindria bacterium]
MAIFTRAQQTIAAEIRLGPLAAGLFIVPALLLAVFLSAAVAVDTAYAGRALPGLRVAGVDVGTLEAAQIRARLEQTVAPAVAAARVRASGDGRTFEATNAELGLAADLDAAVADALGYGHTGTPLARLDGWLDALTGNAAVGLTLRAEGDAAAAWTAKVAAAVDRPAVDAEIQRTATGLVATASATGLELDRERLLAMLTEPAVAGDRTFELPVRVLEPTVGAEASREAIALARAVSTELEVTAGDRGVVEDPAALASFVWTERVGSSYVAWVREDRVRSWAAAVGALLDRPAQSATYRVGDGGAYEVVPAVEGVRIDQEALVAAVVAELKSGAHPARRVLTAPMTTEQPRFGTAEAERHVTQLTPVATFRTAFPLNQARYTNIRIGAGRFDGVVVAPGEELSFWSVFGNDPSAYGFVPAGAIINGISDDSVLGGGLCQVSTTLFNAVAHGGYEILERHQHSYLIERYPTGLDAAVFFPGADMRWRNDTGSPVLIRSAVTPTSVSFTLVSVPTGRTVIFSGPAQSRFVAVTPDLPPDPGHVAGYSVAGRDVTRVRTVMSGDTLVHRDVFWSRYAPVWGGPR